MTFDEYLAERPDLVTNWRAAHDRDDSQDSGWADNSDNANFVRQFSSFEEYVENDHGGGFDAPYVPPPVTQPPPAGDPVRGDASHFYVGRQSVNGQLFDVWQLYDPAFDRVLEWSVVAGHDSRERSSPLRDLGPPSSMTVAQRPAGPNNNPPPGSSTNLAKPTIRIGTTAAGQPIYQLVDASGVVRQWIANGSAIIDQIVAPAYGQLVHTQATDAAAPGTGTVVPPGGSGGGTPGGTGTSAPGAPLRGDASHFYVGRQSVNGQLFDVWQLYDPAFDRVLEWSVIAGHDSREKIDSTLHDLGKPSVMTVAQRPENQTLAKPVIQIGATARGWPVYQKVDDNGTVIQWIVNPDTGASVDRVEHGVTYGVLFKDSVTDNTGGGAVIPLPQSPSGGSDKTAIIVALIGAAAIIWSNQ